MFTCELESMPCNFNSCLSESEGLLKVTGSHVQCKYDNFSSMVYNPGQEKEFDSVLYKLWPLLTPWLAASRCWPCWLAQHTAPVRAQPDSRPRLEGARY